MNFTSFDKAIVAFIVAAAGVLGSAQVNGGAVSTGVLISAAVTGLIAALGVYLKSNKPAKPAA